VLHQVAAQGLVLKLIGTKKETKKQDTPVAVPAVSLPFDIDLEELHLSNGRIFFSEQGKPLFIEEAILQAGARNRQQESRLITQVTLQRLKLDLRDYGVDVQGLLALHDAWPLQLKGSWRVADPGINDLDGTLDAQGDLDNLDVFLTLVAPAQVRLQGKVTDILHDLHWQASAETEHFHLHDIKVDVPVDGTLRIVEASGTIGSYQGTLAADIHYEGYPPIQAEAVIKAEDYTGLVVEDLSLHHEDATLATRGTMHWTGGFSWEAELEADELDPSLAGIS